MTTFPFSNRIDAASIQGRYLREALEHSVSRLTSDGQEKEEGGKRLLQVSGARLVYDVTRKVGSRLVSAEVRCENCEGDKMEILADDKVYNIATFDYLLNGGAGYSMLKENIESRVTGKLNREVIREVMETSSPVSARLEGRITIVKSGSEDKAVSGAKPGRRGVLNWLSHEIQVSY